MKATHSPRATKHVSATVYGAGNHLIGRFLLTIGDSPAPVMSGIEQIHLERPTMAAILRLWRRSGGKVQPGIEPHAIAVFQTARLHLAAPPVAAAS